MEITYTRSEMCSGGPMLARSGKTAPSLATSAGAVGQQLNYIGISSHGKMEELGEIGVVDSNYAALT